MQFTHVRELYRRHRDEVDAAVRRVLDSGNVILGEEVEAFEQELSAYVGVRHCVTCASGTDAIVMALMALGIGPGDEVVTVPFTFISTVLAVIRVGAKPVLVDIEADGFTMDPDAFAAAVTPRTRAVVPVSLFGQMPQMERIQRIADRHGIAVIEDGAQSFGAARRGVRSCGASLLGCTSFYPTKPLACFGDGGAIFTHDADLAARLRSLRVHGAEGGVHAHIGINGRFDALHAATMRAMWPGFAQRCSMRRRVAGRYQRLLDGVRDIRLPPTLRGNTHVYAQYTLRVRERERLCRHLDLRGIPYRVYYERCAHQEPALAHLGYGPGSLPVAEAASREVLSLPMSPWLRLQEQEQVVGAITEAWLEPQPIVQAAWS